MSEINDPAVVAEVPRSTHDEYEAALVANDVAVLDRMFWHSPATPSVSAIVEALYGSDEIAAFRKARPTIDLARTISNLKVVTFGADMAISTIEFDRSAGRRHAARPADAGLAAIRRRLADRVGPRVVHLRSRRYLDAACVRSSGCRFPPRVSAAVSRLNLNRAAAIARPLLEFALPETVEMAPVFHP